MNRLTQKNESGKYCLSQGSLSNDESITEAIDRLAAFENVCENLLYKQTEISAELEKLRSEDKTNTVKFKQLLANKLMNGNILAMFSLYGAFKE